MFKHLDGQNQAELRNYKLLQGQLFKINGKNHYRGVAPYPVTPAVGDTWEELDATGNWIQNWFWNGAYWLSQQVYQQSSTNPNLTTAGTGTGLLGYGFAVENSNFNLFILAMEAAIFTSNNSTSGSNWTWRLDRISTGSVTQLAVQTNQGQLGNTWASFVTPINVHINVGATQTVAMRIRESPSGSANKAGTVGFKYRLARL